MKEIFFLVLGLLLGIPFAIFANAMTPKWLSFWSERSERFRERTAARRAIHDQMIKWLSAHPAELVACVLRSVLSAVVSFLFLGLAGLGLFALLAQFKDQQLGRTLGTVASMVIGLLIGARVPAPLTRAAQLIEEVSRAKGAEWPVDPRTLRPRVPPMPVGPPRQPQPEDSPSKT